MRPSGRVVTETWFRGRSMADLSHAVAATMRALIGRIGCLDAAAEVIRARGYSASKGTLSKKLSGDLQWSISDVIAIEDAVGDWPVRRLLARSLDRSAVIPTVCLTKAAASIAKETGEAVAAVLDAEGAFSDRDRAQALVELQEAIDALSAAKATIHAMGGDDAGQDC